MKQVTLVSLYGQKQESLATLISTCVEMIQASKLRSFFSPYHLSQIHGTIVGMEKLIGYADHFNANSWAKSPSGERVVMNFEPLVNTVKRQLPITVQLGRFQKEFDLFDSFRKSPYERSFQVQWATNRITIIGWPHKDGDLTSKRLLEMMRDDIGARCNIRHKYSGDNDLFIVLGEIINSHMLSDSDSTEMKLAANELETQVRDYLVTQKVDLEIGPEQIFLAQYEKETLPLDSTNVYCINDSRVTNSFIDRLYHSGDAV